MARKTKDALVVRGTRKKAEACSSRKVGGLQGLAGEGQDFAERGTECQTRTGTQSEKQERSGRRQMQGQRDRSGTEGERQTKPENQNEEQQG